MTRRIAKILIANRGEIARRVIRTCDEMGIVGVAVFSEADRDTPFVAEAGEAVALGGAAPTESYLRIDAVIDAARRSGADAIHPGYGFLAENPAFARACADAGLIFIGPSPEAIERMGSKIAAKRLMEEAGVPVLPWAELHGGDADGEAIAAAAERVGWPLLAKASAGGGGKGMRIVRAAGELAECVAASRREAAGAFGDDTLFLERYLDSPRHVEVQIFGDSHGNVVHLFERDCSIQRRYQKIIEESPSPVVDAELRAALGAAAVAAGKAIGYVGAGTVEFLVAPGGEFYFLEVNARLQVEHPVTECVTGLDLVRLQILVAEGEPLPANALTPAIDGHAIEARLYAEDPRNDFLPAIGEIPHIAFPTRPGLRFDTGVVSGSSVTPYYDPMIAKLIAHAPTRDEAARLLASALTELELDGPRTNRDLLVRVLSHPEFLDGAADTHFLERHAPAALGAPLVGFEDQALYACAAALAGQAARRAVAKVAGFAPSGWRNNPSEFQRETFVADARDGVGGEAPGAADTGDETDSANREITVEYAFRRDDLVLHVDGRALTMPRLGECRPDLVELEVDGMLRRYRVRRHGATIHVNSALGQIDLRKLARFPVAAPEAEAGSLLSPMPGKIVRLNAAAGDQVARGDVLIVVEAMKMEHQITAPTDGVLRELRVAHDQQVDAGAVLAVIDEQD